MKRHLLSAGAHVVAVVLCLASGGIDAPEDTAVPLGVVGPWLSGLIGCAVVVVAGTARNSLPLRLASGAQALVMLVWTAWSRAPLAAGGWAIAAVAATTFGSVLAALPRRGDTRTAS
jgi:hypothetical protein